jgi:hypothetical protein
MIPAQVVIRCIGSVRRTASGLALHVSDFMRPGEPTVRAGKVTVEINPREGHLMNSIIYIVGLVVIVIAILGFLGLR